MFTDGRANSQDYFRKLVVVAKSTNSSYISDSVPLDMDNVNCPKFQINIDTVIFSFKLMKFLVAITHSFN